MTTAARWQQFEPRIRAAEQNRVMTARDAIQMRTELSDLARLDAAYAQGGYNADQRAYLTRRYAEVNARLAPTRR